MAWTWPRVHKFGRGCNSYTPTEYPSVSSRLASQGKSVEVSMGEQRTGICQAPPFVGIPVCTLVVNILRRKEAYAVIWNLVVFIFIVFMECVFPSGETSMPLNTS